MAPVKVDSPSLTQVIKRETEETSPTVQGVWEELMGRDYGELLFYSQGPPLYTRGLFLEKLGQWGELKEQFPDLEAYMPITPTELEALLEKENVEFMIHSVEKELGEGNLPQVVIYGHTTDGFKSVYHAIEREGSKIKGVETFIRIPKNEMNLRYHHFLDLVLQIGEAVDQLRNCPQ